MPDAPEAPTPQPEPPATTAQRTRLLAEHARRASPIDVVVRVACGLVLVGLAVGFLIPFRFCSLCSDRRNTALNQMDSFKGANDLHQIVTGAIAPTLDALTTPEPNSGEPYISKIPTDPWGVAYSYRILDAERREYEIRSAGPDRRFGTEDDLVLPERDNR